MSAIRKMLSADLPRVAAIHVGGWQTAYAGILPAERLAALTVEEQRELWESTLFRRPSRTNLVLEDDGDVCGWCAIGPARDDDEDERHTGEIYGIYVDPAKQRHGYGTALLTHAHQVFRDRSYREAVLWVVEGNSPAIQFYERRRYTPDRGARKFTDWLGVPEIRYRRSL